MPKSTRTDSNFCAAQMHNETVAQFVNNNYTKIPHAFQYNTSNPFHFDDLGTKKLPGLLAAYAEPVVEKRRGMPTAVRHRIK